MDAWARRGSGYSLRRCLAGWHIHQNDTGGDLFVVICPFSFSFLFVFLILISACRFQALIFFAPGSFISLFDPPFAPHSPPSISSSPSLLLPPSSTPTISFSPCFHSSTPQIRCPFHKVFDRNLGSGSAINSAAKLRGQIRSSRQTVTREGKDAQASGTQAGRDKEPKRARKPAGRRVVRHSSSW
ncbi:hypothetical protein BKA80DRAFT_266979 [Phyllosticta citrichinensis]